MVNRVNEKIEKKVCEMYLKGEYIKEIITNNNISEPTLYSILRKNNIKLNRNMNSKNMKTKICTVCKIELTEKNKTSGKHKHMCKKCNNEYYFNLRKKDFEQYKKASIKSKYNLTMEEYYLMLEKANYQCEICGEKTNLEIDHNHKTGKVRGMLCDRCNRTIGMFKEDINIMSNAIKYIKERT